jgi:hypothetical protein
MAYVTIIDSQGNAYAFSKSHQRSDKTQSPVNMLIFSPFKIIIPNRTEIPDIKTDKFPGLCLNDICIGWNEQFCTIIMLYPPKNEGSFKIYQVFFPIKHFYNTKLSMLG